MQGNWVHLVILIIFVGFSVISWVYRQLKEQAEKKKARDLLEERKREMLRTGRDPGEVFVPPVMVSEEDQRRAEIAARREAQLAELRRRAQLRQQGQVPRTIPGSAGPTVPRPTARPQPTARPKIQTQEALQRGNDLSPPRATAPRQTARAQTSRPTSAKKPAVRPVVVEEEPVTQRLVPEQAEASRRVMSPVVVGVPSTPEEWRRAIIANEILSPPLAVREGRAAVPF
ncbi:MAG: hypothetical protein KF678_03805 [Phycisphaeraceae bacterium]|nr:hypothetical protein [Phycisphaeraceae bacterium]